MDDEKYMLFPCDLVAVLVHDKKHLKTWVHNTQEYIERADEILEVMIHLMRFKDHQTGRWLFYIQRCGEIETFKDVFL